MFSYKFKHILSQNQLFKKKKYNVKKMKKAERPGIFGIILI